MRRLSLPVLPWSVLLVLLPVSVGAAGRHSASPSANADVYWLRQEVTETLHSDGTIDERHHETARILDARGIADADVTIPYSALSQSVTQIQARTLRPDGSVLRLDPQDVHQTSPYNEFTDYDDARNMAFSLPGVAPGVVIDYQYDIVTHVPICPGRFADACWMAGDEPCHLSRYTLIVPAGTPLRFRAHNAGRVRFTTRATPDGRDRVYRWDDWDAPPLVAEPEMPAQEAYAPWVEVSTWPSWQGIAAWYQSLAARRMIATPAMTAFVHRLTAGQTTETGRAKAIFYWVEENTRYVAIELGMSAYQPHTAASIWRNRYGDCKDMATLMVALLHADGIPAAWPALLDTDVKLPRHTLLATPDIFDHVIVRAQLDGRPYWFDATAQYCPFGEIPGGDRGLEALVVRQGQGDFESIPWGGPDADLVVFEKSVTLRPDGTADCRASVREDGDAGLTDRARFLTLAPGDLPGTFRDIAAGPTTLSDTLGSAVDGAPGATLRHYSLSASTDPDRPMAYSVSYSTPLGAVRTGSLLIFTDGFSFSPPLSLTRRRYPLFVDGGEHVVYQESVTLPAGDAVLALPDDVRRDTPAGTVTISYTTAPGRLMIRKELTLRPGPVSVANYPRLKAAWDEAALLEKRPVVLGAAGADGLALAARQTSP